MAEERLRIEATLSDFSHVHEIEARFADLDPNDHVNNIAVAEMFSEGRNAFVRQMFATVARPRGFHFVVGQAAVRYMREARWPGVFAIGTGVLEIGTCSMRMGQAFFMEGSCRAVAEAVLVAVSGGATVPLDAATRAHLEPLRLSPQLLPRQLI